MRARTVLALGVTAFAVFAFINGGGAPAVAPAATPVAVAPAPVVASTEDVFCYAATLRIQTLMRQADMRGTDAYRGVQQVALDLKDRIGDVSSADVDAAYAATGDLSMETLLGHVDTCKP